MRPSTGKRIQAPHACTHVPFVEGREPELVHGLGGGGQRGRDEESQKDGERQRGVDTPVCLFVGLI